MKVKDLCKLYAYSRTKMIIVETVDCDEEFTSSDFHNPETMEEYSDIVSLM